MCCLTIVQAKLYPNPNNGNFTLNYQLRSNVNADVIIEDVTGKLMYSSKLDSNAKSVIISLTNVRNGIYFVKVMSGKEIISVNKVIIYN